MRIALVIFLLLLTNFDNACGAGNQPDHAKEPAPKAPANLENLPPEIIAHIVGYVAEDAERHAQAEQEKFHAKQDADVEEYLRLYDKCGRRYPFDYGNLERTLSLYGIKKGPGTAKFFQDNKDIYRQTTDIIARESKIIKNTHALHQTCKSLNQKSTPFIKQHWDTVRPICSVLLTSRRWRGVKLLKYYLKRRDFASVKFTMAAGASINDRNAKGQTLLTSAIRKSNVGRVEDLIACGASLDVPNYYGKMPLSVASDDMKKTISNALERKIATEERYKDALAKKRTVTEKMDDNHNNNSNIIMPFKIGIPLIISMLLYCWWLYSSSSAAEPDESLEEDELCDEEKESSSERQARVTLYV